MPRPRPRRPAASRPAAKPRRRAGRRATGSSQERATAEASPLSGSDVQHQTTPTNASTSTSAAKRTSVQKEPDAGHVAVGRVLGPFGLKGEMKVQSLTDNTSRFAPKSKLWVGTQPVTVEKSRSAAGHLYLTLKGFHDRTSVGRFRGVLLQVPESMLPPLAEGEHYRFQLLGLAVVDRDGVTLGKLDEIIETGANDVYRVRLQDGTDLLLPALRDVVLSIDLEARQMVVDPPAWR